jgi:ATP-dependent Lhr-like helicase
MRIPTYLMSWFQFKHWHMHAYQEKMFEFFYEKKSTLLIAPTGGGKTLASFLPSIVDIHENAFSGLHTLYISPLKALTSDVKRNLSDPISQMQLKISIETRTGDTSAYQRKRQRIKPPNMLLTTPESLMLLLSYPEAANYFKDLRCVIIDELHHFVASKRGDLTALALARLTTFAPEVIRFGLSATVEKPEALAAWLDHANSTAGVLKVESTIKPIIHLLEADKPIPYSGYMAKYAVDKIYTNIKKNNMTIVFVNTRAQAEFMFRQLWNVNDENIPIAIYHGSLNKEQRLKTEAMTVAGKLKAIVATSALELGIDWGNVDCVIQVGAPKGVSRLLQRIGRSNHQFDQSSVAILVPSNCFEALECQSAIDAINQHKLDGEELIAGSLDVVIQFIVNCACSSPISKVKLFNEIKQAYPYRGLKKSIFLQLFEFAINGGYTLKHYERYHRLAKVKANAYQIISPRAARRHRQNIGTIIEAARLRVKIIYKKKHKVVGEIEEAFIQQLAPGDTFLFAGEVLAFIGVRDMFIEAKKTESKQAKIPSYEGGLLPLSVFLSAEVKALINTPKRWHILPERVQQWLQLQHKFSALPGNKITLAESFLHKKNYYLVVYTFQGRKANHTLGMLVTRRMESLNLKPLSLTATDYGLAISSLKQVSADTINTLFNADILMNDFNDWLKNSSLMKRAFRQIAIIAGLTERQMAGERKSMKQVTFSTDLIYDVLRKHEPDHVLLQAALHEVEHRTLDVKKLNHLLNSLDGKITLNQLASPSPMSISILHSIKTEKVQGEAIDELLLHHQHEIEAEQMIDKVKHFVN